MIPKRLRGQASPSRSEARVNRREVLQAAVELVHEVEKVDLKRPEPFSKLDDVDAQDASLDLADRGLASAQLDCQVRLAKML